MNAFSPIPLLSVLALAVLTSCVSTDGQSGGRVAQMSDQISQFQSDPEVVAFLAEGAANAGVRQIRAMSGASVNGDYGSTSSSGVISLNTERSGGTSVVNITHEIAHVASFGGACGGHNGRWLSAYLAIAGRFEARFPGRTWSGVTPTARVMRNKERYGIGNGC